MSSRFQKVFFLELNEFSLPLLEKAAAGSGVGDALPNLSRALSLSRASTHTDDRYESDYLEPWVQWASIHTGAPSTEHKIQHLGDVPGPDFLQFWERLGGQGGTSGLWGVMNASRRATPGCAYFLPDPWTFSEEAHPHDLADLLALPRYLSTNYLEISKVKVFRLAGRFFVSLFQAVGAKTFFGGLGMLLRGLLRFGPKHFVFITLFEYLSACAMLKRFQKEPTDLAVLFLNSIAHLQHHHWTDGAIKVTPEIQFGYEMVDKILGRVFELTLDASARGAEKTDEKYALVITNGLTQVNTNEDPAWILYRPHDQSQFLNQIGIPHERVESLMTHDAHIFFKTEAEAERAEKILKEARVGEKRLFVVDRNLPTKVFYRIDFFDEVASDTVAFIGGNSYRFEDLFVRIVKRTGKHEGTGTIFYSGIELPKKMMNHEIGDHLLRHLQ